jgi:hypothetical protein
VIFSVAVLNPVFAPAVRKPGEAVTGKEIRRSIPSFSCPEVEQHLQRFPATSVKYSGWQVDPQFYVALDVPEFYFELNKSGCAPIDPVDKVYVSYESVHVVDTLHRPVLCRRYVENSNTLILTNGTIPSWGCLHSLNEPGCFRFFKLLGDVEFVQLDSMWTRTIAFFVLQFSCGRENLTFSHGSVIKLFVEHNSSTGEWRTHGFVIRHQSVDEGVNKEIEPEQRMCEGEKNDWRLPLPQIPPSKVPEMFSASKIDNCRVYLMTRDIQKESEARKQFPNSRSGLCDC